MNIRIFVGWGKALEKFSCDLDPKRIVLISRNLQNPKRILVRMESNLRCDKKQVYFIWIDSRISKALSVPVWILVSRPHVKGLRRQQDYTTMRSSPQSRFFEDTTPQLEQADHLIDLEVDERGTSGGYRGLHIEIY